MLIQATSKLDDFNSNPVKLMEIGRREASILVIDSDSASLAAIHNALAVEFQQIKTARCLAEAESVMCGNELDLVICEIGAGCRDGDIFASALRSNSTAQILLLSNAQKAGVAFRQFAGGPRFCLQKQLCSELLVLIARQALQTASSPKPSSPEVNSPNFPLPMLTYPSANTNIHSLY